MYELQETPIMEQPTVDTSNFITRSEFEETMSRLKNYLTPTPIETTETAPKSDAIKPQPGARSFDF